MAVGHIAVRVHSRKQGHSAAAALAYRAGLTLEDSRTGETHNYSRRSDRHGIAATGLTDDRFQSFGEFAAAIENAEKRKDASILRDVQPAIPAELDETQGIALVQRFAKELGERYHTATAWAVHRPDRKSDQRNTHAHIVLPTRALENDGTFSKAKLRQLDDRKTGPDEIHAIRALWEQCANEALIAAESKARVHTGRTPNPAPTLGPERTGIERRAYRERHRRDPVGLSVPELVADGAATGAGRRVARHRSQHQHRPHQESAQDGAEVSGVVVGLDSETGSQTRQGATESGPPVPLPLQSPDMEIAAIDREIATLKREAFELFFAEEIPAIPDRKPAAPVELERSDLFPGPSAKTPPVEIDRKPAATIELDREMWRSDLFPGPSTKTPPVELGPEPVVVETAVKPKRGEDWTIRSLASAGLKRTAQAPQTTAEEGRKSEYQIWLEQGETSTQRHTPGEVDDPEAARNTRTRETPRTERENKTVPVDEIARQRRQTGAVVAAHADKHGREPTAQERTQALRYLDGSPKPRPLDPNPGTPRPALGTAVDLCARARLADRKLKPDTDPDPFTSATRSPAAATIARRMTEKSIDEFKTGSIVRRFVEWQKTFRSDLMKRIIKAIIPHEIEQIRTDERTRERSEHRREPLRTPSSRRAAASQSAQGPRNDEGDQRAHHTNDTSARPGASTTAQFRSRSLELTNTSKHVKGARASQAGPVCDAADRPPLCRLLSARKAKALPPARYADPPRWTRTQAMQEPDPPSEKIHVVLGAADDSATSVEKTVHVSVDAKAVEQAIDRAGIGMVFLTLASGTGFAAIGAAGFWLFDLSPLLHFFSLASLVLGIGILGIHLIIGLVMGIIAIAAIVGMLPLVALWELFKAIARTWRKP